MRLLSIERITGLGLLTAALTIFVLAVVAVLEVRRDTELHRDLIGAQQVQVALEAVRSQMHELKYAARDHVLTADPEALREVARRTIEMEAELLYLENRAGTDEVLALSASTLDQRVRRYAADARESAQLARERGGAAAKAAAARAKDSEALVWETLERALDAQTRRVNEQALAQIQSGENLNFYVLLLLAAAIFVLASLFAVFLHAQSKTRAAQRHIERLAHFDPVTSLPNRTLLADRFSQELTRAQRSAKGFAVALFDLDGFKEVNDSFGHAAGDALLAQVAQRSRESMRTSDTVGRLGGDEFLAILPEASREGALLAAEKLRSSLEKPYDVAGKFIRISASVGVALFPEHGRDADALYRAADTALYAAKGAGKNRVKAAAATVAPVPI